MASIESTGYNKAIGDKLNDLESQIETCSTFIAQCEEKSQNVPVFTEEQVKQNLSQLKEFAKHSEREVVRSMIQSYVECVTVYNDKVEVVFKAAFTFSFGQNVVYTATSSISRK